MSANGPKADIEYWIPAKAGKDPSLYCEFRMVVRHTFVCNLRRIYSPIGVSLVIRERRTPASRTAVR
jgi:hypothetical protein